MSNVRDLINWLRAIALDLECAIPRSDPDECSDKDELCYIPAKSVKPLREHLDGFTAMAEKMKILPPIDKEDPLFSHPFSRVVRHIWQLRTDFAHPTHGDVNVRLTAPPEELIRPLMEAERWLTKGIKEGELSEADDGFGISRALGNSSHEAASGEGGPSSPVPQLMNCHRKAWDLWREARQALSDDVKDPKDEEAYKWLAKRKPELTKKGIRLPAFETWARYVRRARRCYDQQKNARSRSAKAPPNLRHSDVPEHETTAPEPGADFSGFI